MIEYKTSTQPVTANSRGAAADGFSISGYLTRFNELDLGGDYTVPGAFLKTIQDNPNPPILWSHDVKQPPIGIIRAWREDATGVFFVGELANTTAGRDIKTLVEQGSLSGISYGYNVKKSASRRKNGVMARELQELEAAEVSLTTFPMLPSARLTGKAAKDALIMAEFETLYHCGQRIDQALFKAYREAKRRQMLREIKLHDQLREIELGLEALR